MKFNFHPDTFLGQEAAQKCRNADNQYEKKAQEEEEEGDEDWSVLFLCTLNCSQTLELLCLTVCMARSYFVKLCTLPRFVQKKPVGLFVGCMQF